MKKTKTAKVIKTKEQHISDLKEAFNDIKLYEQGKKKLKSAKDLLKEI